MDRIKHTLTRLEARQVEDYLLKKKDIIVKGELIPETIAEHFTQVVGRTVTVHNVKSCASTVGVEWPKKERPATNAMLKSCIGSLARELAELYGELGHTVSPTLEELSKF